MCLGNNSGGFSTNNMKKTQLDWESARFFRLL